MKINVLVTGVGGGGHGEQILKALKLAYDLDIYLVGTDVTEFTTGKKLVDQFYVVPPALADNYAVEIIDIIKKHDINFVFHGSEAELTFMSDNRGILEELGVGHPLNSSEVIALCMNKYLSYCKMLELGIDIPKFKKIDTLEDIQDINFYPLVLKPNTGSGGSAGVSIVTTQEECELITRYMLLDGIDIIAQAYVGDHECEYTIGVSSDATENILGSIAIKRRITNALSTYKKIRRDGNTYVISSGLSQGDICHNPPLQEQAEHIAKMLQSKGPMNIQCREINGKLMIFEINPRLSGTTSLRAMAGYNEPEAMLKQFVLKKSSDYSYKDLLIGRTISEVII